MTKEEFLKQYQTESNLSDEQMIDLLKSNTVSACDCDYEECQGWKIESDKKRLIFHKV
jgi:hypothetical protein